MIICHVIFTRHKPQTHNVFVHNKQSRQLHFWCIINIPFDFNCTRNDLGSLIILFVPYNSGIIASMHLWCSYLETAASFRFQVCYGLFQMKQMVNITLSKYEYFSRFNVKLCFKKINQMNYVCFIFLEFQDIKRCKCYGVISIRQVH